LDRQAVFQTLAGVAVITNSAIAVFTMDTFQGLSTGERFWIFILFQWVVFSCQVQNQDSVTSFV
jgi:hypothetical protein